MNCTNRLCESRSFFSTRKREASALFVGVVLSVHCIGLAAQEHRELLKLAVDVHRSNRAKIRTWTGILTVTDSTIEDNAAADAKSESMRHELRFAWNAETGVLKWDFRWDLEADVDPLVQRMTASRGLRRDGSLTIVRVFAGDRPAKQINVMAEDTLSISPRSDTFDPMYFLGHQGQNPAERLQFLYDQNAEGWKIERNGPLLTLSTRVERPVFNEYVINLDEGAALVRYVGRSADGQETWEWEYQKVSNVWVPRRLLFQNTDLVERPNEDGGQAETVERTRMRLLEWKNTKVNEPVPDAEFTYGALGIEDGDRITDERTGEAYAYRSKN